MEERTAEHAALPAPDAAKKEECLICHKDLIQHLACRRCHSKFPYHSDCIDGTLDLEEWPEAQDLDGKLSQPDCEPHPILETCHKCNDKYICKICGELCDGLECDCDTIWHYHAHCIVSKDCDQHTPDESKLYENISYSHLANAYVLDSCRECENESSSDSTEEMEIKCAICNNEAIIRFCRGCNKGWSYHPTCLRDHPKPGFSIQDYCRVPCIHRCPDCKTDPATPVLCNLLDTCLKPEEEAEYIQCQRCDVHHFLHPKCLESSPDFTSEGKLILACEHCKGKVDSITLTRCDYCSIPKVAFSYVIMCEKCKKRYRACSQLCRDGLNMRHGMQWIEDQWVCADCHKPIKRKSTITHFYSPSSPVAPTHWTDEIVREGIPIPHDKHSKSYDISMCVMCNRSASYHIVKCEWCHTWFNLCTPCKKICQDKVGPSDRKWWSLTNCAGDTVTVWRYYKDERHPNNHRDRRNDYIMCNDCVHKLRDREDPPEELCGPNAFEGAVVGSTYQ